VSAYAAHQQDRTTLKVSGMGRIWPNCRISTRMEFWRTLWCSAIPHEGWHPDYLPACRWLRYGSAGYQGLANKRDAGHQKAAAAGDVHISAILP